MASEVSASVLWNIWCGSGPDEQPETGELEKMDQWSSEKKGVKPLSFSNPYRETEPRRARSVPAFTDYLDAPVTQGDAKDDAKTTSSVNVDPEVVSPSLAVTPSPLVETGGTETKVTQGDTDTPSVTGGDVGSVEPEVLGRHDLNSTLFVLSKEFLRDSNQTFHWDSLRESWFVREPSGLVEGYNPLHDTYVLFSEFSDSRDIKDYLLRKEG